MLMNDCCFAGYMKIFCCTECIFTVPSLCTASKYKIKFLSAPILILSCFHSAEYESSNHKRLEWSSLSCVRGLINKYAKVGYALPSIHPGYSVIV